MRQHTLQVPGQMGAPDWSFEYKMVNQRKIEIHKIVNLVSTINMYNEPYTYD